MAAKDTAARTVTVACKALGGVVLYVCEPTTVREMSPTGDRAVTVYVKGDPVRINGPEYPRGSTNELRKQGFRAEPPIEGGYALTHNVPKAFWDAWLEQNADTALVKSRMIFAFSEPASTKAAARENEARHSGLEPLNPDGDYRVAKPLRGVSMVEPAETGPPE
jgi:hypothetical protein